jgi:hypothetical protein
MKTSKVDCASFLLFEILKFEKGCKDFDDIFYGHYTMECYSKLVRLNFL